MGHCRPGGLLPAPLLVLREHQVLRPLLQRCGHSQLQELEHSLDPWDQEVWAQGQDPAGWYQEWPQGQDTGGGPARGQVQGGEHFTYSIFKNKIVTLYILGSSKKDQEAGEGARIAWLYWNFSSRERSWGDWGLWESLGDWNGSGGQWVKAQEWLPSGMYSYLTLISSKQKGCITVILKRKIK